MIRILAAALFVLFTASSFAQEAGPKSVVVADSAIDPAALEKLKTLLEQTNSRQALVMHEGRIVAEWYWRGAGLAKPVEVWSLSKSMASTAIGLLIDEGKIASIKDPVSKYIPAWGEGMKARATLENILNQTTGIKDVVGAGTPADLLQRSIDAEILHEPGTVIGYNNGGCNLISAVVRAASGEDIEAYMRRKMWEPLGMKDTSWRRDDGGNVITYAGVQSTARDIGKFGQLFLDGGTWNGKPILSRQWIEAATTPTYKMQFGSIKLPVRYGYLWWVDLAHKKAGHNYNALGLWGNNLTVIPDKKIVGVRLVGNNPDGIGLMLRTPEWVAALSALVASPAIDGK